MKTTNILNVLYQGKAIGTLALSKDKKAAFAYDNHWLETGFSISPFSLPLKKQVFLPTKHYFQGLFGVFGDSLPDSWGRLLLKRMLKQAGENIDRLTPLDWLGIVGISGMGALTYQPQIFLSSHSPENPADASLLNGNFLPDGRLDRLSKECFKILNAEYSDDLDALYAMGGTSGGARPKIMTQIEKEDWIIKFPAHIDGRNAGKMEYDYSLCARKCGIDMPKTHLFPSKECAGYFGIQRFDRIKENGQIKRIHMISAAALLEIDFQQPSLDYHSLMKLTKILTRDRAADMENMFRRMCFNVFAHNRDDHSKNFSFLYNDQTDEWRLSPAYDLTYSNTYYGEHTTSVDGNGKDPGKKELLAVGMAAGLKKAACISMIAEIRQCVQDMLGEYCCGK